MTITSTLIDPSIKHIDDKWSNSDKILKRMGARVVNLLSVPAYVITCALDTILGLGIGLAAICMLGMHKTTTRKAMNFLGTSKKLIAEPYMQFVKVFNPKHDSVKKFDHLGEDFFYQKCGEEVINLAGSDNFIDRNISARLGFVLIGISHLITAIAESCIGIIALSFSILTLTQVECINKFAYTTLQFPGILADIFVDVISIINPSAI